MKILIIKLGAAGDVVRTTTLLHKLKGEIDWVTSDSNVILLEGISFINHIIKWSEVHNIFKNEYDLVINLEDSEKAGSVLSNIKYKELFGAYINNNDKLVYTESSNAWFDLSLISRYGLERADELKFENTKSFQELIFKGLGYDFNSEPYLLPKSPATELKGDVAISSKAGNVWPMKNWAFYEELADYLKSTGLIVNYLPERKTMLQHLSDIRNHKYLISGDSLPMHFALGSNIKCLTIFICTSPSEIFDYRVQSKIVSPNLKKYFYKRGFDEKAVRSISLPTVIDKFKNLIV